MWRYGLHDRVFLIRLESTHFIHWHCTHFLETKRNIQVCTPCLDGNNGTERYCLYLIKKLGDLPKMRLIFWVGKWLATTCLISMITMIMTWYMVNAYVDALLRYFHINPDDVRVPMSDVLTQVKDDWQPSESVQTTMSEVYSDEEPEEYGEYDRYGGYEAPEVSENTEQLPSNNEVEEDHPEDAIAVWGQASESSQQEVMFTIDSFEQLKEQLTVEDKMEILKLIYQLPQEVVQELSLYMENGITAEEMRNIEELINQHLDDESIENMIEILQKY